MTTISNNIPFLSMTSGIRTIDANQKELGQVSSPFDKPNAKLEGGDTVEITRRMETIGRMEPKTIAHLNSMMPAQGLRLPERPSISAITTNGARNLLSLNEKPAETAYPVGDEVAQRLAA